MSAFSPKQGQPSERTSSNTLSPVVFAQPISFQQQHILNLQRTIGNQAVLRLLQDGSRPSEAASASGAGAADSHPRFTYNFANIPVSHATVRGIQRKLTVNTPGDVFEQEADHVAEQVMRMPEPAATATPAVSGGGAGVQRECACGGSCDNCKKKQPEDKHAKVQMKASGPASTGGIEAPPIVHEVLHSPGQPLDAATRSFMEPRFGHDFSKVRVHTDEKAVESARTVNARAYTVGSNVVLGAGAFAPGTDAGQRLLGHELTHVVQQGQSAASNSVQRQIVPENVSSEMVGQEFSLRKDFSASGKTLAAATGITVVSWDNKADTVEVRHSSVAGTFKVPKVLLQPKQTSVPGIAPYTTDLEKREKLAESHGAKLEAFKKTAPKDRMSDFATDLAHREVDQANLIGTVNTRLIQGSMLNRFDASIQKWVDFYNTQFSFKGKDALDPNLVKAIMYRESSMGTNEPFMHDPPTSPIMTRFTLLQAVDSPINDMLPIMREMLPALIKKYHLENIEKDLLKVEIEFDKLKKEKKRTPADEARFHDLLKLEDWAKKPNQGNWGPWFSAYPGYAGAVKEFLETLDGGKKHSEDYDFWIRDGIRALFSKRAEVKTKTWEETVRHYNPGKDYFKFVERHRRGALAAEKKKQEFIPENL
jgi:hypothetical protein